MKKLIRFFCFILTINISVLVSNSLISCSETIRDNNNLAKIPESYFDSLIKKGLKYSFVKVGIFLKINYYFYKLNINQEDLNVEIKSIDNKDDKPTEPILLKGDTITISGTKTKVLVGSIVLKVV